MNFETRDSFRMVLDDTRPIEFLNETLEVPEWRLVAKSTTDGTKDIGKEEQLAWRRSHQALRKQSYATYLLYLISP